jgi:cold shock protein
VTGVVKRVFLTRGFGFVLGDDGLEYFLHIDALVPISQWEKLCAGVRVEFIPAEGGKKANGLRAMQVRLL